MSDQAPPPWFDQQGSDADQSDWERRKAQLEEQLPDLLKCRDYKGRAQRFYPYLLLRSVLGDRGDRPINTPFWESPDIWTALGDPAASPDLPPSHGGTVQAGQANTVYAHVWNLGFAPLAGVRVEFFWFDPSLAIDGAHAHSIGVARCELAGRGMAGSHKLLKCPTAWVPVMENGGHECLMVRISGVGDAIGNNEWQPWENRHVAQRNISVVAAGATIGNLVTSLNLTRRLDANLQLIQLGPREGALAAGLVTPQLRVAAIDTHVLGELTVANEIVLRQPATPPAGMFTAVHPLASGIDLAPPVVRGIDSGTRVVDPSLVLSDFQPERPIAIGEPAPTHLADLLASVDGLHDGRTLDQPAPGEAFVLRMASYVGDQLVGGYTLVIGGQT